MTGSAPRRTPRADSAMNRIRWPEFDPQTDKAVLEVLHSGRVNYWTGEKGREFEAELAKYLGVKRALAVSSGSAALELALRALGVGPGDEVVVTPYSFRASATCVSQIGATPVFADVGEDHMLNADTIAAALTPKTKAVVVVHLYGQVADMDPILALAKRRRIKVIEDCAQCLGGEYRGRKTGTLGDAGCFSFCQSKHITTGGEGGAVVAKSAAVMKKVESLRDHGWRVGSQPKVFDAVGGNYRLTEIQSVIGLGELKRFESWNLPRRRDNVLWLYGSIDALQFEFPGFIAGLPVDDYERRPSFWLVPFVLNPRHIRGTVKNFIERVQENGGDVYRIMWPLMAKKPVAARLIRNTIGFWVHPTLTEADIDRTVAALRKALEEFYRP